MKHRRTILFFDVKKQGFGAVILNQAILEVLYWHEKATDDGVNFTKEVTVFILRKGKVT